MEFLIVIGLFALISVISAAVKKNARTNRYTDSEDEQQSAPPPRASTMSDIQRAFMMMSDEEEPKRKAPSAAYTAPQRPMGEGYGSHEGTISHEGKRGSEGIRGMHEGVKGMHEGVQGRHEGTASRTQGKAFHRPGFHSTPNKYANVDLNKYTSVTDTEDQKVVTLYTQKKKSPLKLFENKDAFTKAVIYSEILNRKSKRV